MTGLSLPPLPSLVEASAGTGKTHAITTHFVRALLEQKLSPSQILVVTYTKAATAELRVRTRTRVAQALEALDTLDHAPNAQRDLELDAILTKAVAEEGKRDARARLRRALSEVDQARILTIHGFCQRLLQDYPLVFGIDVDFEVVDDPRGVVRDLAVDFWASELHDKPRWFLDTLRDRKLTPDKLEALERSVMVPDLEVLGPPKAGSVDAAYDRWLEALKATAEIWRQDRALVLETLLEGPALNKQSYQRKRVEETWTPWLDGLHQARASSLPEGFERLARRNLKAKKGFEAPDLRFFDACESLVDAHAALQPPLDRAVFEFQKRFIDYVRDRSRARSHEHGQLTYDDLLRCVHDAIDRDAADTIREDYPFALIDEFQDTDAIQYQIFRSIFGSERAVYVGDPKQAIYGFRGADVFSYIAAAADAGDRQQELSTNRRSDPHLVRAVQTLFTGQASPFVLDEIRFVSVDAFWESRSSFDPAMEIVWVEQQATSTDGVASIVANEIGLLLQGGDRIEGSPITPAHVAVLCRTNDQAARVTEALQALDIPASFDGDSSVFGTAIASDLEAALEAALTPGNLSAIRRALLTPLLGVTPSELMAMPDAVWSDWVTRFREWHGAWHEFGVTRFLEELLRVSRVEVRLAEGENARRQLTDLIHLEELLLRGERERRRDPVALMLWFRRLRAGTLKASSMAAEELQRRPDAESNTVRVTTIHKSKGLEYGVVYCPFLGSGAGLSTRDKYALKFHDPSEDNRVKLDLGSGDRATHLALGEREALSEALRVLYVAVTRAKHRCTLFWGEAKKPTNSALGYLLHGPLDEKIDATRMQADIDALSARSGGVIRWRNPHVARSGSVKPDGDASTLTARRATRTFSHTPRIASFTSLTGQHEKTVSRDREAAPLPSVDPLFKSLPPGARSGLLLHAIAERVPFDALADSDSTLLIERELGAFGYDPKLALEVARDLQTVVETPLFSTATAPRLIDIPRSRQLHELEFTLRLDEPDLGPLPDLLRAHGAPRLAPDYPARVSELPHHALARFLRGYVDLVFEWEGRWYLADYKSNLLPTYTQDTLVGASEDAHYLLQMLLYSAAVNRHLSQRIDDFDPATQWGGVLLLFLRGMHGCQTPGAGVYFDPQSAELIAAVDRWLGGSDGAA